MKNSIFNFNRNQIIMLLVASLGYFVDIYDMLIFSAERVESLKSLGVTENNMKDTGILILNFQIAGLIVGGFLIGKLADTYGRLRVLFISILTYSLANIINAFVIDVNTFKLMRFIAGLGLAGELGVALSWISESLDRNQRTVATMIVSAVGLCGGIAAGLIASKCDWQTSYLLGGVLGLLLLVMRMSVSESQVFEQNKSQNIKRGSIKDLLTKRDNLKRLLLCVFIGAPAFVFFSIFITLSPEICKSFNISDKVNVGSAIIIFLLSFASSDVLCGFLSKILKNRKTPLYLYAVFQVFALTYFFHIPPVTLSEYYLRCAILGFSIGYWGIVVTNSVEQFGTNLRATVATSTPNLIRGLTIPASILFGLLSKHYQLITSASIVGYFLIGISIMSIYLLEDKFENDLNFNEQ